MLNPESQILPLILLPDAEVVSPGWAAGIALAFFVSGLCAFPPPSSTFSLSLALVADPAYRVLQSKALAGVGWQDFAGGGVKPAYSSEPLHSSPRVGLGGLFLV